MRATFPNPDDSLLQGDFGRVILYTKNKDKVAVVPQEATMENQEGRYLYILDKDNLPKMAYIKTMGEDNGKWLVSSGVNVGDRIITGGIQKVIQGRPVRIVERIEEQATQKKVSLFQRVTNKVKRLIKGK